MKRFRFVIFLHPLSQELQKMKKTLMIAAAFVLAASVAPAAETVIFSDNFESYADTTAVEAAYTASVPGAIVLTTAAGTGAQGSDKFVTVPAAPSVAVLTKSAAFTAYTTTDTDPISITAYLRTANWANSRNGVSVRDSTLAGSILNVGSWNAATANVAVPGDKYTIRALGWGLGATGSSYWNLQNGATRTASAWVKLKAIGALTTVKAEINDVNTPADDITGSTTPPIAAVPAAFSVVRIGLGVTTPNAYDVDSITVATGLATSDTADWDLYH